MMSPDLHADLRRLLASAGGPLEQTFLYLDGQSAADFVQLCNSSAIFVTDRNRKPLEDLATRAARLCGSLPVRVHALGCGDGKSELRLVQALFASLGETQPVQLHLLDISHTLLTTAYRLAESTLEPRRVCWFSTSSWRFYGPLHRNIAGITSNTPTVRLQTVTRVPGSYELQFEVRVSGPAGEKTFMMFRSRRYDPERLQRLLKDLSWEAVQFDTERQTLTVLRLAPRGYVDVMQAGARDRVRAEPFGAVELLGRVRVGVSF